MSELINIAIPTEKPVEDFKVFEMPDGIYLKVNTPIEDSLVFKELKKLKITVFKSDVIATAIKEANNKPVRIADLLASTIGIMVKRDRMEAVMNLVIPPGAPQITMEQILAKITNAGIIHGIDKTALERLVKSHCNMEVVCASGTSPCDGTPASLQYHVDIESQGRPTELEDGSVDFKNINSFINVEPGQLLVEKIPPTPGISGKDVLGLTLKPKPGKDISMPKGKNMTIIDNCHLISDIAGQLHVAHNRINVLPTIEIAEDVDLSTGNIDFVGNVIVRGSLQSGFSIKAIGNVEIYGTVCGGMIEAGNVIVHRGIQGMNRSVIKSQDKVAAKFVENATIYADHEVIISDVVLNSSIFSGLRVIVEGRRGRVVGGRISAGEEIRIRTVGNLANIATDLQVSSNPFLKDELNDLKIEKKQIEATFEELKRSIAYILSQGVDNLNAEKRERYDKMQEQFVALPLRLEEIELRRLDIKEVLSSIKPGKIGISDVIYPGVRVSIGILTRTINDALKYLSLYVHEGEIKFSSFK